MKWFKSDKNGGGIKSSPVIYNGRIYVCGGGGHGGSNEPFRVIDANTMTEIYQIPDLGSLKERQYCRPHMRRLRTITKYICMLFLIDQMDNIRIVHCYVYYSCG